MRKISVRGTSGSGKTTFAAELARRLEVAHVELDALHHGPNWSEPSAEEFRARVEPLLEQDGWVIDGNYESKLDDLVTRAAGTVVWLDLPLRVSLRRLWRRTRERIRDDIELWNGNKESWRGALFGWDSLFVWAIRSHFRRRRTLPRQVPPERLVRLRSDAEARRWLEKQS
jgi:adenylate kinase family enzyme